MDLVVFLLSLVITVIVMAVVVHVVENKGIITNPDGTPFDPKEDGK